MLKGAYRWALEVGDYTQYFSVESKSLTVLYIYIYPLQGTTCPCHLQKTYRTERTDGTANQINHQNLKEGQTELRLKNSYREKNTHHKFLMFDNTEQPHCTTLVCYPRRQRRCIGCCPPPAAVPLDMAGLASLLGPGKTKQQRIRYHGKTILCRSSRGGGGF